MTRPLAGSGRRAGPGSRPPTPVAAPPDDQGNDARSASAAGSPTEVTINGTNLKGNPELDRARSASRRDPADGSNADAANWKTKLDGRPRDGRRRLPDPGPDRAGLSNPFLFAVGQLPQVAETEDNSTFETAQAIPSPVVVEGQAAGNDVDYFKFAGKKGERIVVDAQCARIGSGVDPSIRLTTAGRRLRRLGRRHARPAHRRPARRPPCPRTPITSSRSPTRATRAAAGRSTGWSSARCPMAEEIYPLGGRGARRSAWSSAAGRCPTLATSPPRRSTRRSTLDVGPAPRRPAVDRRARARPRRRVAARR